MFFLQPLQEKCFVLFSLSNRISNLDAEMVTTKEMGTARNLKERGK